MKKNYLKLVKTIGTMDTREDIIKYLCSAEERYLIDHIDEEYDSIYFQPAEPDPDLPFSYEILEVCFNPFGKPKSIYKHYEIKIPHYRFPQGRMLVYFPDRNKFHLTHK